MGVHRRSYYESDEDRDEDEDGLTTPSSSTGDREDRESVESSGFGSPRGVGARTGGVETESDEDWEEARVRVVGPAGVEAGVFIPPVPAPATAPQSHSQGITTIPLPGAWVGVATNPNRGAGNGERSSAGRRGGMRELAEMVSGFRIRADGPSSSSSSHPPPPPPPPPMTMMPQSSPYAPPPQQQQQQPPQGYQPYLSSWISSSTATLRGPTAVRPITPQEVFIPPTYTPSPRPFHNTNGNDEDEEEETDSESDGSMDRNTLLSFPEHEGVGPAHPHPHPPPPQQPPHPYAYQYPYSYPYPPRPVHTWTN